MAELRIANTELGGETLALADDGCLDASAGFAADADDRRRDRAWRRGVGEPDTPAPPNTRRLGPCRALVPEPAYEGAAGACRPHTQPTASLSRAI